MCKQGGRQRIGRHAHERMHLATLRVDTRIPLEEDGAGMGRRDAEHLRRRTLTAHVEHVERRTSRWPSHGSLDRSNLVVQQTRTTRTHVC